MKKMVIINVATETCVAEINTNHSMSLDDAINFVGKIINNAEDERFSADGDNVIIDGVRYWYEDLDIIAI